MDLFLKGKTIFQKCETFWWLTFAHFSSKGRMRISAYGLRNWRESRAWKRRTDFVSKRSLKLTRKQSSSRMNGSSSSLMRMVIWKSRGSKSWTESELTFGPTLTLPTPVFLFISSNMKHETLISLYSNKMHEELGHYRLKNAEGMAELDRIRRLFENEKMERESALEELKK